LLLALRWHALRRRRRSGRPRFCRSLFQTTASRINDGWSQCALPRADAAARVVDAATMLPLDYEI
jgi:hypothetical protein